MQTFTRCLRPDNPLLKQVGDPQAAAPIRRSLGEKGFIMWVTSAFIVLSFIAALVFFCALVIAGRSDEERQPEEANFPAERLANPAQERPAERDVERSAPVPALSQKI